MRKYIISILLMLSTLSFATKELSTLKTLKFNAEETQIVNVKGREKEKLIKYKIIIEFPNKIKKEITFPELNKGEVYVYDGEKKLMYLPIFDEYKESQIDGDENRIIQTINKIRNLESSDIKFKADYQKKKLSSIYVDESQTTLVNIKEYLEQDEYILPKYIEIQDKGIKLGTVLIKDVEINPKLTEEVFKIEKGKK